MYNTTSTIINGVRCLSSENPRDEDRKVYQNTDQQCSLDEFGKHRLFDGSTTLPIFLVDCKVDQQNQRRATCR